MKWAFLIISAGALAFAAPLPASVATLAMVNATGSDIQMAEARKAGSSAWAAIPNAARQGTSGAASFDTADCAWDLRLTFAGGGTLTFANVNLCEARLVTLRQKDGVAWVDYD